MREYIEAHLRTGDYVGAESAPKRYENRAGWMDYPIGAHAIFAHRSTDYTQSTFRDVLHAHHYCEVLFRCGGDVQYVSGDLTVTPQEGSVIVIPPSRVHTTRLLSASHYERYVLYFSESAFSEFSEALGVFLDPSSAIFSVSLAGERLERVKHLLSEMESLLSVGGASDQLTAYGRMIDLLLLIAEKPSAPAQAECESYLPASVIGIRRYIEEQYASILSVESLAAQFYYSREYVTRLFRSYYNLSPGDYLEQCRIRAAIGRIADGERIADVCFGVGYRSMSAFSAAFHRVTGESPSAYRRAERNIHK